MNETTTFKKEDLWVPVVGICLLGITAVVQLICLVTYRILTRLIPRSHLLLMSNWIFLSSMVEQLSFIVFHVQYQFLHTDFDNSNPCTVYRCLGAFISTFSTTWLLISSCWHCMLAVNPSRCKSFHSRFMSHCVVWTWSVLGSLMYITVAYLANVHSRHVSLRANCWYDVTGTIHIYLTYGHEVMAAVVLVIVTCIARTRIRSVPVRLRVNSFVHIRRFLDNYSDLKCKINAFLCLCILLCVYYAGLIWRFQVVRPGSDIYLMLLNSFKGLSIAVCVCFADRNVILLYRCRLRVRDTDETVKCGQGPSDNLIMLSSRHTR